MSEREQLKVFISSPGDVEEERRRAALVLGRLRREFQRFFDLVPVLWEYEPLLASGHFQDCIEEPAAVDIVVVILWSRLGTPLPARTGKREYRGIDGRVPVTGTEWEYEEALRHNEETRAASPDGRGIPDLLVYRKDVPGEFRLRNAAEMERAHAQMAALEQFWERHFETREGQFLAAHHRFVTLDQFDALVEQHLRSLLIARINRSRGSMEPPVTWMGSPFRGLQSFEIEHAPVFFGRDRAVRLVTEALARWAAGGTAFVLVLGASGCGKSSLVRAGVVANLSQPGVVSGVDAWRRCVFRPGGETSKDDLFDRLATTLAEPGCLPEIVAGLSKADAAAQLRRGEGAEAVKLALIRAAQQEQSKGPVRVVRLVFVVDQLEELFTGDATPEQREAFGQVLLRLARSGAAWVVASMRSDFFHRLAEVPSLHGLVAGEGIYHLAAPRAEEIDQMIRLPAEAAGLAFEKDEDGVGLEAILREAAAKSPDAMPLLEFALEQLYHADVEVTGGRVLRLATYNDLGRLEGAIAAQAETVVAAMPKEAREALPAVLLSMVSLGEGDEVATAQPAARAALDADKAKARALEGLVAARLVVSLRLTDGTVVVTLAHEALLQHWPRLKDIAREHRDFLRARRNVTAEAALWQREGNDPSRLLAEGNPLAEGEQLLLRRDEVDPKAIRFVEVSAEATRQRREAELDRQRHEVRRTRFALAVVALLAIGAGIGAWFGFAGQRAATQSAAVARQSAAEARQSATEARHNAAEASRQLAQAQVKESRFLAEKARAAEAQQKYESAMAIALAALPTDLDHPNRPLVPEALTELSHIIAGDRLKVVLAGHTAAVLYATFSPSGDRIVTASNDNTARLWDARTGAPIAVLKHVAGVNFAVFSASGDRIVTASADGTARVWDGVSGALVMILKHDGPVQQAAFSPSGDRIVTSVGWPGRTAMLWDARTGAQIAVLRHDDAVRSAKFSPSGDRIVTTSDDSTARVWDGRTGAQIAVLNHDSTVYSATFSPSGDRVVTASFDATARLWDARTGAQIAVLKHNGNVYSATFSPSGDRVLTASDDGTARLWDGRTGAQILVLSLRSEGYWNTILPFAAFSPTGDLIVSVSGDHTARLWDARTGAQLAILQHDSIVNSAAFSSSGDRIVTTSGDAVARLWDARADAAVAIFRHGAGVNSAAFSPSGDRIVTAANDNTARLWNATTGAQSTVVRHDGQVMSAAFSPSGDRIVTASNDRTARLWDARTGAPIAVLKHDDEVILAAFSASGDRIVTASSDNTAGLWDARTGALLAVLKHDNGVASAVFSASGDRIVTASNDNTARLWDARTGAQIAVLKHDNGVTSAVFSASGDRIVTASVDNTARLWDGHTGAQIAVLTHDGIVWSATFDSSGDRVVTASSDGTARLWDARTGVQIFLLQHQGAVNSAAFSPTGDRVVTASDDSTARLWDARTGAEIAILHHDQTVRSAAFSPSGDRIVTASADGTARLWQASPPAATLLAFARLASIQRLRTDERRALFLDPLETENGGITAEEEAKREQELARRLEGSDGAMMDLKKVLFHHALAARLFEEAGDEANADLEVARRGSIARAIPYSQVAQVWEEVEAWWASEASANR